MSVVNQMLMDLERRGALPAGDALGADVRAARQPAPRDRVLPLVLLAVVAAAAWAATRDWRGGHEPPASPASRGEVRVVQPAAQPPVPREAPESAPPTSLKLSSLPAPPAEPPRPQREARSSERVPLDTAAAARKPAAPAPLAAAPAVAPPPARAEAAPPQPSAIDKLPRQLTPQQQAENDFARAAALLRAGRIDEAVEALRGVLRLNPGHVPARQTLAALLVESRRVDEAAQVLQEGLAANPQEPRLAMVLARLQADRGDYRAALDTLQGAAAAAAGDADYRGLMGTVCQRLSRHGEAVTHYLAAAQLSPQTGVWWMGLGISLQAEGRIPDAREAYQRAKATRSLSPELVEFVDQRLARLAPKQ